MIPEVENPLMPIWPMIVKYSLTPIRMTDATSNRNSIGGP